jgi:hypothetical protein
MSMNQSPYRRLLPELFHIAREVILKRQPSVDARDVRTLQCSDDTSAVRMVSAL